MFFQNHYSDTNTFTMITSITLHYTPDTHPLPPQPSSQVLSVAAEAQRKPPKPSSQVVSVVAEAQRKPPSPHVKSCQS